MQTRSYDPRLARAVYARWLAAHDRPDGREYARALAKALAGAGHPGEVSHAPLSAADAQAIRHDVLKQVSSRRERHTHDRWTRIVIAVVLALLAAGQLLHDEPRHGHVTPRHIRP